MAIESASGLKILREHDDVEIPTHLYAEKHFCEFTFETVTFTAPAAATAINTTESDAGAIALGSNNGCTQGAITAGTATVNAEGVYRVYFNGIVTADNGAALTIAAQKNAAAFSPVVSVVVAPLTADLIDSATFSRLVTLVRGDVIRFVVTASAGNAVLTTGSFGIEQVKSSTFRGSQA
jgi:hypothetical protein